MRAPAGDPEDLTLRAIRVLTEAAWVVAEDLPAARQLLTYHQLAAPLLPVPDPLVPSEVEPILELLRVGDLALLLTGPAAVPAGPSAGLVAAAIGRGATVVPVPGPDLLVSALLLSGLPVDGFVYLGRMPAVPPARAALLASVASERRTLVVLECGRRLAGSLREMHAAWGERPLAVVTPSAEGEVVWRGATVAACESPDLPVAEAAPGARVLVIGGAHAPKVHWEPDRLETEIQALLQQGLGTRLVSEQLAAESGWSRREVYRLVVAAGHLAGDP